MAKKFRKGKKKIKKDELVNIKQQTYWKKPENVRSDEIILERRNGKVKVLKERLPYQRKQTYWIKTTEGKTKTKTKKKEKVKTVKKIIPPATTQKPNLYRAADENEFAKMPFEKLIKLAKERFGEREITKLLNIKRRFDTDGRSQRKTVAIIQVLRENKNSRSEDRSILRRHTVIRENGKIIHNGIKYKQLKKEQISDDEPKTEEESKFELENPNIEEDNNKS